MSVTVFANATLVLPDRIIPGAVLQVRDGRITFAGHAEPELAADQAIDLEGLYLAPGFVDLHVHGGDGADFMDGTPDAFRTVCRCHARHGTTSLTPTSTVATGPQYDQFLALCRALHGTKTGGARIVGGHFYGPYFARPARGCHPDQEFLVPAPENAERFMSAAADMPLVVTVAPEIENAEWLVRTYSARGVRFNAGHSYATFPHVEAAVAWGVRHVDHLFCAMSDRARLRQSQAFPMRAGLMEATLFFDELTTEVIADGKHLTPELLRFAYKVKGPDRLALVTDSMRAVDRPDGEYWFGAEGSGEKVRKRDGAGVTLEGTALASGVMGMDHCLRTMHFAAGVPLPEAVRMASLTPARILGVSEDIGSLEPGKRADLVVLDRELNVKRVYIGGEGVV
ncbi:N-acetylglucosamine-6-phosphate deacetylase [Frigoriglobus tundricola]|uniref:N-acetylglucosamine-6-phosphate deacetylase n=1 Tax=Frigoriglobus tundricola TaxID=2774151 RepID=A0A6M5YXL6_9BACT|nr:N-acetylglucosamine-6-phosphate deacetylase [Frigoriglobus tundricola]QJW98126.1 N-acetylglucosamine-6-phosphate deacetylase [Frigoriglobus tundricola]